LLVIPAVYVIWRSFQLRHLPAAPKEGPREGPRERPSEESTEVLAR
jgi:hypothetical protein